jgi:hypothetical protein
VRKLLIIFIINIMIVIVIILNFIIGRNHPGVASDT